MGITWFAQDALGEVVFFDPPEVGTSIKKDEPYAEVESVKAVSDVIAPLSGEIVEVNTALGDSPEAINKDPYGEGWLVKVRLSDVSEKDSLMDVAAYQPSSPRPPERTFLSRYTATTDADLEAMLAEIGARALQEIFDRQIPAGVRLEGPLDLPAGCPSRRSTRTCASWPPATRRPRTRSRSSAPGCTTTTSPRSSTCSWAARSS